MQLPLLETWFPGLGQNVATARKIAGLVVFPLVWCLASAGLFAVFEYDHERKVALAREGVQVTGTVVDLREEQRSTGNGSKRERVYVVDFEFRLGALPTQRATQQVPAERFRTMRVGDPYPLYVRPTDPTDYASVVEVQEALSTSTGELLAMAVCGGGCCGSIVGLLVAFGRSRRRTTPVFPMGGFGR